MFDRRPDFFREELPPGRQVEAKVKWFNASKGFGFVTMADGSQDAFLPMAILRRAIPRALQTRTEAAPFVTTPDAGARFPADHHESLAMDLRDTIRTYGFLSGSYDFVFGPVFHPGRKEAVRVANDRPSQRILEVGVGTGLSLPYFRPDSHVTGIDVSAEMLEKAKRRVERKNLSHVDALHVMDAEHMSFEDNSFDAVLALYVASVVPNPARFAEEMRRVCIPGGTIVLVNHFTSENWALRRMEKRLAHLARHIGFHSDFPLDAFLRDSRLSAREIRPSNLFGYWRLLRCINEKPASTIRAAESGPPASRRHAGQRPALRCSLLRIPFLRALLAKAGKPLGGFGAAPARRGFLDDPVMQGVERRLDGIAQQLFGDRDRFRPGHQQVIDNTRAGRVKLGGRADVVHEPDPARRHRIEALAGQRKAAGVARADAVDQQRNDRRRGDAPAHFADRKERIRRGERDVAGCGDPDPAAKAAAMHERDRRPRKRLQAADRRHGAAREFVVLLRRDRAQPVEKRKIGAELKMLPRAFDDNAAQPRLAVEPRKRVDQPFDQRAVIGIADAWPVQRDGRDAAPIDGTQNRLLRPRHSGTTEGRARNP